MNPPRLDFGGSDDGLNFGDGGGGDGSMTDGPIPDAGPDKTGPAITITAPMAGAFIGGVITITAAISDASGVDDNTVLAVFGGDLTLSVKLVSKGNDQYSAFFDVGRLGTSFVFPSLSVRADDKVGNHSDVGIELIADNVPPTISLDPPNLQLAKHVMNMTGGTSIICSSSFDPVGSESANDGAKVQQVIAMKARVEDHGNTAPGLLTPYISFLNPGSVKLVLIPAANAPLVVDVDGDGICDEINPLLIPVSGAISASDQSIEINLAALSAGGTPDYFNSQSATGNGPCNRTGDPTLTQGPELLCKFAGTSLTTVFKNGTDPTAEIFSIPPIVGNDYQCIGLQFDSKNRIGYGKACAAVQAADVATNVGVSAPLHICVDDAGATRCTGFTFTATECTGKLDTSTMTVVPNSTCTPRSFPASNEVIVVE